MDSREEDRQRYLSVMGVELGELYLALSEDLQWVFIRWIQFKKLFGEGEARLDVLNRSAGFFFWVIQQALWEDTILAVTRLAAPEKSLNRANLTIRRIPPLLDRPIPEILRLIGEIDSRIGFAKVWRNTRLAHRDLALALKRAPELPNAEVSEIDAVLDLVAAALNAVSNEYLRTTTAYRQASLIQDADDLVFRLRDGLKLEDQRMARLENGEYRPEDWFDADPSI